ncbi:LysR family transcriptional regulator [Hoeflea sp. TYP-13]|uniref:LysR family transcriptional regulator n=1 Tax=Hoeflea sp. TYP-13 TaxID=3230023 RepID=UPI0034C6A689
MKRKSRYGPLPSINALRSFETTARLGSVTKAADELCVTPSAVSHQIRKLEEIFGRPLIEFVDGRANLTEWGTSLLPGLTDGFMRIRGAVNLLQDQSETQTLTIAARPLFASKWLSPRLDRFWEMHPDIALRMRYLTQRFEASNDTADASIEWYAEHPRDANCVQLFPAALAPICSPKLNVNANIESLSDVVLLSETLQDYWRDWFNQMNVPDFQPGHTAVLDDGSIRLNAAIAGKGVDMSVPCFLEQEFAAELLIEPFPNARLKGHYYLMLPEYPSAKAIAFQAWILDEVADDPMVRSQEPD